MDLPENSLKSINVSRLTTTKFDFMYLYERSLQLGISLENAIRLYAISSNHPNLRSGSTFIKDLSNTPLTYFDDGPSVPLVADIIENILLGAIPPQTT